MTFGEYVKRAPALVVQPRMGFGDHRAMRRGLAATRAAEATTVGTITVDSYTRTGDLTTARTATSLNGYPIATHPTAATRSLHSPDYPVQVRHGSSTPAPIVRALTDAGLHATEGGPVSYCLPYGRTPLAESVANWRRACEHLAEHAEGAHVESFGGCLLGQLCPPSLLIAVSVLESVFFTRHGIRSVSLSYAQQTSAEQDAEALHALRTLAAEHLPADTDWHVVLYTYMGVFPRTARGARNLLAASAELAVRTGAERLIVKTTAEAHRIPTVEENVAALELAAATAATASRQPPPADTGLLAEARALVDAVLDLHPDIGTALAEAFATGVLDVPFCAHPDNAGQARGTVDADGWLRWSDVGAMPIAGPPSRTPPLTSERLLSALHQVARKFDR
ncbi:methylaspartate mutase [Actinokineospora sp. 24-640]